MAMKKKQQQSSFAFYCHPHGYKKAAVALFAPGQGRSQSHGCSVINKHRLKCKRTPMYVFVVVGPESRKACVCSLPKMLAGLNSRGGSSKTVFTLVQMLAEHSSILNKTEPPTALLLPTRSHA